MIIVYVKEEREKCNASYQTCEIRLDEWDQMCDKTSEIRLDMRDHVRLGKR